MTIEADLFTKLKTLVANRVYPETFIQPNGALPVWPAIRYSFTSAVPDAAICGDSGDLAPDTRIQIDVVDRTFLATRTLSRSVMTAMETFAPPVILENGMHEYDAETKTYREILDYMIYKST